MKYFTNIAKALLGVAMVFFVVSAAFWVPASATLAPQRALDQSSTAGILEAYGKLPLSFQANQGQADGQVQFLARGSGYELFLTATEAVLALHTPAPYADEDAAPLTGTVLRMTLLGAHPQPHIAGRDLLPGTVSYLVGSDPTAWRTDIPTYAKVAYQDVYPGVDLIYYGNQGQLEYDFVVAPGADPASIALGFAGADSLAVDAQGDLVLRTAGGEIRQQQPLVYQELNGIRQEIAGRYVLTGQNQVGFAVDAYDPSRPLVIDPVLVYSTFLGGSEFDQGLSIAVDSAGSAYVTGITNWTNALATPNFPTTPGAFDASFNGRDGDVFVTKLNPTGTALVYSTFLGGGSLDEGKGIAVDSAGSAYVTGQTLSTNFPTTPGAFDTSHNGFVDAFITKLNPTGTALVYSTFLGGSGGDRGLGIAVDSAGSAYVAGQTDAAFPTTPGAFDRGINGDRDAFVTKLDPAGAALVYSTYLGSGSYDSGNGIAVDSAGNAYVTGHTRLFDFPTTTGAFDTSHNGIVNAFVTKLNPAGTALVYSTFLGGSYTDHGYGIAVDSAGNAYVTGQTGSTNFPTTPGAFDRTFNSSFDAFVTKLDPAGAALVYSTYLGGSNSQGGGNEEEGRGIAVDSAGNAYVTGYTRSGDFPTTPGAFDRTFNGDNDAFITKLNPAGTALVYSTYLGGSFTDQGYGIAVDSAGNAYVTGATTWFDFPTTPGAFDRTFNGSFDGFVAKLSDAPVPVTLTLTPAADTNPVGTQHCLTATVHDASGSPIPNITVRFSVAGVVTTTGSATTNQNGQASFCYSWPATAGDDTITAYADTDADTTQDAGEPFGTATKTWIRRTTSTSVGCTPTSAPVGGSTTCTATVSDTDSGAESTPTGTMSWSSSDVGSFSSASCTLSGSTASCSVTYTSTQVGTHTITAAYDGDATHTGSGGATTVVMNNVAPSVLPPTFAPPSANEGEPVAASATFSDPGANNAPFTCTFNYGDGTGDQIGMVSESACSGPAHIYADNGMYDVTVTVSDAGGAAGAATASMVVNNVAPTVGPISAPLDPVALSTPIAVNAAVSDPGSGDTHTADWDWGDGTTSPGTLSDGTASGSHTYAGAGIYTIRVSVIDDDGGEGQAVFQYVVVYDPSAGFVTGGGWIDSPAGAYTIDPSLTGRASFGFTSRYQPGATVPTGVTRFRFQVADLHFQSESYEWLVVAGARAQYKGTGTINGAGNYGFMLTAIDGQLNGGGGVDKFRIKIWDKDNGDIIVYDNQLGAADDATPATGIGGGAIIIHTGR